MSNHNKILDECGCCEGVKSLTPAAVENSPGLSALAYRVGTHSSFKKTMHSGLSTRPALGKLTTRENDDPAIALLDAWAAVLDVLSFYQERMINEGYLRTAKERRSILELARHISYKLGPGVAAGTYLAFLMEDVPGAPTQATISVGTRVQSIPGQDELPQIFETVEEIQAKVEWNAIKPRMTQPQDILTSMVSIILEGTTATLKQGDILLIVIDTNTRIAKKIMNVTINEDTKTTRIDFDIDNPSLSPSSYERPSLSEVEEGSLEDLEDEEELSENAVQIIIAKSWKEEDLSLLLKIKNWSAEELVTNITEKLTSRSHDASTGVFALRKRAFVFGYNAPKQTLDDSGDPLGPDFWEEWTLDENNGEVFLDNAYDEVVPHSYAVIKKPDVPIESAEIYEVTDVRVRSRTAYGLSSKTTLLFLSPAGQWWDDPSAIGNLSLIRDITIYTQSERLETADVPIEDSVQGDTITLDGPYPGLKTGQRVILTGEHVDLKGIYASETKILKEVILEAGFTVITFEESLDYSYVRNTVTINANAARATHGETKTEVLGSGDGSKTFQEFQLKQKPLTYVSAATPSGVETTLEVRVNDISWKEVPTFYGVSSEERVYVTRIADDGTVTVQFGDGITGARLSTGVENVKAFYRVGTGLEGMLAAGQLSLLMTKPLGVKGAVNPLAPTGADNPERRDQARQNAPLTVLTLDRIVSLRDYEDFSRAFIGIGKARADLSWKEEQRVVHITVAAADGGVVDRDSDLYKNLIAAIDAVRHPVHRVEVDSYELRPFDVKARVLVDSDYIVNDVLAAVSKALQQAFSFDARSFGQDVTPSEVVAVMQGVKGVTAVDLEELDGQDPFAGEHFRLSADTAELLTINPYGIDITEMIK